MKVLDPGHSFALDVLDPPGHPHTVLRNHLVLDYVKREGPGFPGNEGHYPGTNMQEVMRSLISRLMYLDKQVPDFRNARIVFNQRNSLWLLEQRAAERHGRILVEREGPIETWPTCGKCGHVGHECNNFTSK